MNMDPFQLGHRTTDEQTKLREIVLSRSNKTAPSTLREGQFPNPPPLLIFGGVNPDGQKTLKSLKQVLTTLDVTADIQEFIKKAPARSEIVAGLMAKSPSGPLAPAVDFKPNKTPNPPFNTKKSRKDALASFTASVFSVLGSEVAVRWFSDTSSPNNPKLEDQVDDELVPNIEKHFLNYLRAIAKLNASNAPVSLTQVVGVRNRTRIGGLKGKDTIYQYDPKVYLLTVEMDGTTLQNIVKRDGNAAEQVDVKLSVTPQKANLNLKGWEGLRSVYDDALRVVTSGKGLDEVAKTLIVEVEPTPPPGS